MTFTVSILCWWVLGISVPVYGSKPRQSDNHAKAVLSLYGEIGPIVKKNDAPQTYALLEEIEARLEKSQKAAAPGMQGVRNRVLLVDSPTLNAFASSLLSKKSGEKENIIVFTTELFKALLKKSAGDSELLKSYVTGVASHELAHPIDYASTNSLHAAGASQQNIEIRADLDAAKMLGESQLPRESLHDALEEILDRDGNWEIAAAQSHPEKQVRLGASRTWLTLDRFTNGDPEVVPLSSDVSGIAQEIGRIHYRWDPFKVGRYESWTLDRVLSELDSFPSIRYPSDSVRMRYNFLLLKLQEILASQSNLAEPMKARIAKAIVREAASENRSWILNEGHEATLKKYFGPKNSRQLAQEVPLYRDPNFLNYLRADLASHFAPDRGATSEELTHFFKRLKDLGGIANDSAAEALSVDLVQLVRQGIDRNGLAQSAQAVREIVDSLSPSGRVIVASRLHSEIFSKLPAPQLASYFANPASSTEPDPILMELPKRVIDRKAKKLHLLSEAELQGLAREVYAHPEAKALATRIWNSRESILVAELLGRGQNPRWTAVFEILGMDPEAGKAELRESFKKVLVSDQFTQTLRLLQREGFRFKSGSPGEISWADAGLLDDLRRLRNPSLEADAKLRSLYRNRVLPVLQDRMAEGARLSSFNDELSRAIQSLDLPTRSAIEQSQHRLARQFGQPLWGRRAPWDFDLVARSIDQSALPQATKTQVLRDLFLKVKTSNVPVHTANYYSFFKWTDVNFNESVGRTFDILLKNRVFPRPSALLETMIRATPWKYQKERVGIPNAYFFFADFIGPRLEEEVDAIARSSEPAALKKKRLLELSEIVFDPWKAGTYQGEAVAGGLTDLRRLREKVIETGETLGFDDADWKAIHRLFSATAATNESDRLVTRFAEALSTDQLRTMLAEKRVFDDKLKVQFLERFQKDQVARLEGRFDPLLFDQLLTDAKALVPEAYQAKDEYLEKVVWKLKLDDLELLKKVETLKSSNWGNQNSYGANIASGFSDLFTECPPDVRRELLEYLRQPSNRKIPASVDSYLRQKLRLRAFGNHPGQLLLYQAAVQGLEKAAYELRQEERVPILDVLLSQDPRKIATDRNFQREVIHEMLKIEPGSLEEKALLANLETIPKHERSVTLAYLLSLSQEGKTPVRPIFEVHQSVGKKVGQLSATWRVFDDEITDELQELKDRAKPLSKLEVIELLKKHLSPQEFAQIQSVDRVLGAASIKTVIEVKLKSGEKAVLGIAFPKALNQIRSNVSRGRAFLSKMAQSEDAGTAKLLERFLVASEEQLIEETDFLKEAKNVGLARKLFLGLNQRMQLKEGGWRFAPLELHPAFEPKAQVIAMKLAPGVSIVELADPVERKKVGKLVVEGAVRGLFEEGLFNPDMHRGNVLLDSNDKTIHPIDFGQFERLQKSRWILGNDERLKLGLFLWAVEREHPEEILDRALALSSSPAKITPALRQETLRQLREVFATAPVENQKFLEVFKVFSKLDLPLDNRLLSGALKGLVTLQAEGYVSPAEFKEILRSQVSSLLKSKAPRILLEPRFVRNQCERFFQSLGF